ncbi:MAG: hypothetical protein RJS98_09605 [Rhodospirillaceae bacterium]
MTDKKLTTPSVRVLKRGKCQNLSGKPTLSYEAGVDHTGNTIWIRITANSGGGMFNGDWVSTDDIVKVFSNSKQPITSHALVSLFKGKSANNAGFLMAVLKHLSIVKPNKDKPKAFELDKADTVIKELIKTAASKTPKAKATKPA